MVDSVKLIWNSLRCRFIYLYFLLELILKGAQSLQLSQVHNFFYHLKTHFTHLYNLLGPKSIEYANYTVKCKSFTFQAHGCHCFWLISRRIFEKFTSQNIFPLILLAYSITLSRLQMKYLQRRWLMSNLRFGRKYLEQ